MNAGVVAVAAVAGYLFGSVSPSTSIARRRGLDLRSIGSGNPGATNASRAMGRRVGIGVAGLDLLKGLVAAAGFGLVGHTAALVAGVAAVLGHVTSPWLRGRGGKGVATAAGAVLGVHPWWGLLACAVWLAVLAGTRWVALASVCATGAVLVTAVALHRDVVWAVALNLLVLTRHIGNFRHRP